jgi:hypothetical protein
MLRKLQLVVAVTVAGLFVQAASAAPPGSTHLVGSGSTVWGVWNEGSQSFSVDVFTTPGGLGGHIKWQGAKATDSPTGPLVHYSYSGHPDCLAVSGNIAVTSVVHYYPHQVFPYQGAIVIAVDNGSVDQAWAELLEAGDQASAQSVCSETLDSLSGFGPLPTLNGDVTVG